MRRITLPSLAEAKALIQQVNEKEGLPNQHINTLTYMEPWVLPDGRAVVFLEKSVRFKR